MIELSFIQVFIGLIVCEYVTIWVYRKFFNKHLEIDRIYWLERCITLMTYVVNAHYIYANEEHNIRPYAGPNFGNDSAYNYEEREKYFYELNGEFDRLVKEERKNVCNKYGPQ